MNAQHSLNDGCLRSADIKVGIDFPFSELHDRTTTEDWTRPCDQVQDTRTRPMPAITLAWPANGSDEGDWNVVFLEV